MIRPGTVLLLGCTAAIAAGLFWVKYRVASLEDAYVARNAELLREQEAIHVLKAEWAYLNNPERLERLAGEYLEIKPLEGRQLVSLASLPLPRAETEPRPKSKPGTPPASWPLVDHVPAPRNTTVAAAQPAPRSSIDAAVDSVLDQGGVVLTGGAR
ncbi:hypothetical protein [Tistrella mobilis]|uniref:Periplasmic protein n=1 Tax=Tistrella mobilis (strain KA081020-065) TaxID=1110502 RepID=I3TVS0_TISMK|nr:hypothetical protein [Tistrella mobilis]AFK56858.1 periplasmic protein [Tistrella mobilis KA081020-065]